MIQLSRPLATLDLETTGVNIAEDRIIQIAIRKIAPGTGEHLKAHDWRVNPGIPINKKATEVHGITDEMVKDAPYFSQIAGQVFAALVGCDILGFNSNYFDCPLLFNEFARAGYHWDNRTFNMVDAGNLFKIMEPRSLDKAVEFYLKRAHTGAHDALVDVDATLEVFEEQLVKYEEILPKTIQELSIFTNYGKRFADLSGKFYYDDQGELRLSFGQKKDLRAVDCMDYIHWMYFKANFADDTRAICEQLLNMDKPAPDNEEADFGDDLPF